MQRLARPVALLAFALAVAACGDSDDGAATTSTSTPAVSSSTTVAESTTTTVAVSTTTEAPLQLTENAKLSTGGLGPVRIGMTLEDAERASGLGLEPDDFGTDECRYYSSDRGPADIAFMVSEGEVVRVDVFGEGITTLSGYGVGSTGADIVAAFGERIETNPHPYTDGQYVVFVPVDEVDLDKRVIWETDTDDVVTAMRAGRLPFVDYIEGCA